MHLEISAPLLGSLNEKRESFMGERRRNRQTHRRYRAVLSERGAVGDVGVSERYFAGGGGGPAAEAAG